MTAHVIQILVVEDYEPFRRFVRSTVQNRPGTEVVCEVADGLKAIEKAQELRPDLILLDIGLPKLNGIEAARVIRTLSPKSIILFVSQELAIDVVKEGLSTGASGYVVKADAGRELLTATDAVLRGEMFVSSRLGINLREHTALHCRSGNLQASSNQVPQDDSQAVLSPVLAH